MSAEPCERIGQAAGSPSPEQVTRAGRKARRGPAFETGAASRAGRRGAPTSASPSSRSSAGRAKTSKVVRAETGFPGRPNTRAPPASPETPNTNGFPGRMATAVTASRTPFSSRAGSTKSKRPMDTPPEMKSASAARPLEIAAASLPGSSPTNPSRRTGRPSARQREVIMWLFASRILAGPGERVRGWVSSSPVESTVTRGRRPTRTRTFPTVASSPIPAGESRPPASRSRVPARTSAPLAVTRSPARTGGGAVPGFGQRMNPELSAVCSTITAASAPSGIGAPVMMAAASPGPTRTRVVWPAAIRSTIRSRTLPPASEAACTA